MKNDLIYLALPKPGSSIAANKINQTLVQLIKQAFPQYAHTRVRHMAAGSVGGASAHQTIVFKGNGFDNSMVIVRVR